MIGHVTIRGSILAAALVVGIAPSLQAAPLTEPASASWDCKLSTDKVLQGINAGLISKGWRMTTRDDKGHLVAEIVVRNKHTLVVDISYTRSSFEIRYKSSQNLKYKALEDGTAQIHNNANKWMRSLQENTVLQLNGLCSLQ